MSDVLKFARVARKLKAATAGTVAGGVAVASSDQLAVLFLSQLLANFEVANAAAVAQGLWQIAMIVVPPITGMIAGWSTSEPASSIDWGRV